MTWTAHRWIWRLEGPLSIGMPPAAALNRCRLYVPARAIWGAITSELARIGANDDFPDYERIGKEVKEAYRFTYLYPAEKIDGEYHAWVPQYCNSQTDGRRGFLWSRTGRTCELTEREFRRSLMEVRAGTAISPQTDSAEEGSLRSTECISQRWKVVEKIRDVPGQVYMLGYYFEHDSESKLDIASVTELFLGGDTRYGLGHLRRVAWDPHPSGQKMFGLAEFFGDGASPKIHCGIALGHCKTEDSRKQKDVRGAKELLAGWRYSSLNDFDVAWMPGTCSNEADSPWMVDVYGFWRKENSE